MLSLALNFSSKLFFKTRDYCIAVALFSVIAIVLYGIEGEILARRWDEFPLSTTFGG